MTTRLSLTYFLVLVGCNTPSEPPPDLLDAPTGEQPTDDPLIDDTGATQDTTTPANDHNVLEVIDIALASGFDGHDFGYFKRGRACIAGDFDLDGRIDVYQGSPGDDSVVYRNILDGNMMRFDFRQTLSEDGVYWAASAADYDNDGDWDMYLSGGGNEGIHGDKLFENQAISSNPPSPFVPFLDVTDASRLEGPVRAETLLHTASAGGNWADFNQDGWVDLLVSVNAVPMTSIMMDPPEWHTSRNILWKNNGDGTFTDVAETSGLSSRRTSRHSSWIDIDNDGDLDLYESNFAMDNILWRNNMVEGSQTFTDITALAGLADTNLAMPRMAFASAVSDLNNDGWQDLIVFTRPGVDCTLESAQDEGLLEAGHAVFINVPGEGFVDATPWTMINNPLELDNGVMGCQVGDLNMDGIPDIYIGNGGPPYGQYDQMFLSNRMETINITDVGDVTVPVWANRTDLIDYPAPELPNHSYPPYPYRTHGTCFTDFDGDGLPEIGVINGGPSSQPDFVREPNRLFKFVFDTKPNWLKVLVNGDGQTIHRDAFHTRVAITVSQGADGDKKTLWNTKFSASAFSAQNGPEILFGLGSYDTLHEIKIIWPNNEEQVFTDFDGQMNQRLQFDY